MNKGIVKEGILGVLQLKWQSIFKNYRKRIKKEQGITEITADIPQPEALSSK